jgi:hypothetical protein
MSGNRTIEERIARWLEEEADGQLPDRVLRSTFERTRAIRRRPGSSAWRLFQMPRFAAPLVAVGATAIVVLIGVIVLGPRLDRSNVGGPATPSPAASPTTTPQTPAGTITLTDTGCAWEGNPGTLTNIDIVTIVLRNETDDYADFQLHWVRNGHTYEEGVALVAEIARRLKTGEDWPPNDVSAVVHAQGVAAHSQTVSIWPTAGPGLAPAPELQHGSGWNLETGSYGVICSANTSPTGDVLTTFLVGPLHLSFLLTGATGIDTSGWPTFASTRHGYEIRHPADRSVQPASAALTYEFLQSREGEVFLGGDLRFVAVFDDMFDTFAAPDLYPIVGVMSTRVPDGMSEDEWLTTYAAAHDRFCVPPRSAWVSVPIDSIPSGLYEGCGVIEALTFFSGRAYTFSVTRGMGGVGESDADLLRAMVSTVAFRPEVAIDAP